MQAESEHSISEQPDKTLSLTESFLWAELHVEGPILDTLAMTTEYEFGAQNAKGGVERPRGHGQKNRGKGCVS